MNQLEISATGFAAVALSQLIFNKLVQSMIVIGVALLVWSVLCTFIFVHLLALDGSDSSKNTLNISWWVWPKNCPAIVLSNLPSDKNDNSF